MKTLCGVRSTEEECIEDTSVVSYQQKRSVVKTLLVWCHGVFGKAATKF